MKVGIFEHLVRAGATRRDLLKGAASVAALAAASTGTLGALTRQASAQDNLRAEILKIPGVGKGSPTDADWQKVGELCLGATKANVSRRRVRRRRADLHGPQQPEPAQLPVPRLPQAVGGLYRRQDQLDRSRPGRLQPAPAAVDRDRHGRLRHHRRWAPPSRATRRARACSTRCPTGCKQQIDMDDYVDYLKAPVGTWDGKTYRITIDGDCHTFAYRKDYFGDGSISGMAEAPRHLGRCPAALRPGPRRQDRSADRRPGLRLPRPAQVPWGGFGFYFLADRAAAYAKHPGRPGLAVRPRHDEAARQQSRLGAGDPGRDRPRSRPTPIRRIRSTPIPTPPPSSSSSPAPAARLTWWGDVGSNARTSDTSVVGDVVGFSINPGARAGLQLRRRRLGKRRRTSRPTWPISAGVFT